VIVADSFGCRPSELITGLSGYEAYCFDVASTIYLRYLQDGEKPLEMEDDAREWL